MNKLCFLPIMFFSSGLLPAFSQFSPSNANRSDIQQMVPVVSQAFEHNDNVNEAESDNLFNDLINRQNNYSSQYSYQYSNEENSTAEQTKVTIDLDSYHELKNKLENIKSLSTRENGPAVVLGSSEYVGKTVHGALSLKLTLHVTLGHKGVWKTVPLVGDDAILVSATVNGVQIPVSRENKYHVWFTKEYGEVTITVDMLVPPKGPRGSIEYDFMSVRTPGTNFDCVFPVEGLEPRLTAAIQSETEKKANSTRFTATLRPTSRIHIIGFKEMGDEEQQDAKVYTETMNLLSIDETALELFSVFYYTILYSGAQKFNIMIPKGLKVISADGRGAFRYNLESVNDGTLLTGETEFPIHNKFEISLRLRRELQKKGETFVVPLPRCINVERESGWLGVEIPGKMRLEEKSLRSMLAVDIRQLPQDILQSAVSPVLKAYRYHSSDAAVTLHVASLPEIEPVNGSIDNIQSFSKITDEGTTVTDLRITMRNRLRHNLVMELPEGGEVLSAMIDEEPLNISMDDNQKILLPLKRSNGTGQLKPFIICLTVKSRTRNLKTIGIRNIQLPSVDLPVSSISWEVYLPGFNTYSRLRSNIEVQQYAGEAGWAHMMQQNNYSGMTLYNDQLENDEPSNGDMPVQFKVPLTGKKLIYKRYWLEKGSKLNVSFSFVRSSFLVPVHMFLILSISIMVYLLFSTNNRNKKLISTGVLVVLYIISMKTGTVLFPIVGSIVGIITIFIVKNWFIALIMWLKNQFTKIKNVDITKLKPSVRLFGRAFMVIIFSMAMLICSVLISMVISLIINKPLLG